MAASDARPVPQKGVAYRVTFPIWDADGDLVTGATGLDSEVSKDGGTFADCTNEATEIATASGMYYLDLTATEMTADTVAVIVKTSTSGAKTTPLVLYPEEAGDIRVNVTQVEGVDATDQIGDAVWGAGLAEPAGVFNWATTRATFRDLVQWLGALARNKATASSTTLALRNDADSANLGTASQTDDGTTYTRGEWS